ncbi:hypothetical protein [Rosistilla oblonga]|uniref:hypothetical protein n=1 Tax=Rosistilla oblonga TaxID=2527990 RepID=UPI003A98632B
MGTVDRMDWQPFAAMNLLRNPFGELTREDRVRAAVVDVADCIDRLQQPQTALQFIADCGRGKTTHLLSIAAQAPAAAYVYLPEDERCPPIPHGQPLLIDEAQRLPWLVRRRAFARGGALVLGTHVDLTGPLRRAGYRVWTYHVGQDLTAERLAQMLNRRIQLAQLCSGPIPQISETEAADWMVRHGSDIRAIEFDLYERFQQQIGVG